MNGETVEGKGYAEVSCTSHCQSNLMLALDEQLVTPLSLLTHQTLRLLTTAGDMVELLIAKGQRGANKLTVMLNKEEGKLGFRITKQNGLLIFVTLMMVSLLHHLSQLEEILITTVTSNTQAAQAGLRAGDAILQVSIYSVKVMSAHVMTILPCTGEWEKLHWYHSKGGL